MRHHFRHVHVSKRSSFGAAPGKSRIARLGACLIVTLATYAVPTASASASASAADPAFDGAFEKLAKLELGQGLDVLHPIRKAVVQSRVDEKIRTNLEARLIAILQSDATDLGKDHACRQLVIVG